MTRLWAGILLLTGLFLGCMGISLEFQEIHVPIWQQLEQAAALSQAQPEQAQLLARQAQRQWEDSWEFTASFADHTPMEEIDALFGALQAYLPDSTEFQDYCLQLIQRTRAMTRAQAFRWWNLL